MNKFDEDVRTKKELKGIIPEKIANVIIFSIAVSNIQFWTNEASKFYRKLK